MSRATARDRSARARNATATSPRAPVRASPVSAGPAAIALAVACALVALLRLFAPAVPEGWAWAIRWSEWLPIPTGALPLAAVALLAIPALGERLAPAATTAGSWLAHSPRAGGIVLGALLAVLVFALADETRFTGDFLLRVGVVREGERAELFSPQSLPLDVLVNGRIAQAIAGVSDGEAGGGRVLGALWAFGFGLAGVALARVLALEGAAALVCALAAAGGGGLALCTGYPKAFGPLAALAIVVIASAFGATRGRALVPLAIATALALLWHRSALALVPVWLAGMWEASRSGRARPLALAVGWLLPPLAFAPAALQTLRTLRGYDAQRHIVHTLPDLVGLSDRVQVVLDYAPLALIALVALALVRPARRSPRTRVALAAVMSAVALLLLVQPQQGVPRDWDVYAAGGGLLAALVAAAIGRAVASVRGGAAAAPAMALLAITCAVAPLAAQHDPERGAQRARAIVQGPPPRTDNERALIWDYLGIRAANLGRMREAGDAWAEAATLAPSPRMLHQWGWAELKSARPERALKAFSMLLARDSTSRTGWVGLFAIAVGTQNMPRAREIMEHAIALSPNDPSNAGMRETLVKLEQKMRNQATPIGGMQTLPGASSLVGPGANSPPRGAILPGRPATR